MRGKRTINGRQPCERIYRINKATIAYLSSLDVLLCLDVLLFLGQRTDFLQNWFCMCFFTAKPFCNDINSRFWKVCQRQVILQ